MTTIKCTDPATFEKYATKVKNEKEIELLTNIIHEYNEFLKATPIIGSPMGDTRPRDDFAFWLRESAVVAANQLQAILNSKINKQ